MSESTNEKDQHDPASAQVTGGGGPEPDQEKTSPTEAPAPKAGQGVDLKSSDLGDS
jgi:hypothetical protein